MREEEKTPAEEWKKKPNLLGFIFERRRMPRHCLELSYSRLLKHPLSPVARRSAYAVLAIIIVMIVGTIGVKELTGSDWVYSFFYMSMIATGQGPPANNLNSPSAEIFIAIMAFVSVGTVITSVGVIFGPFFGYLFHIGVRFSEKELEKLESERQKKKVASGGMADSSSTTSSNNDNA
jgi:hypothetical protein